MFYREASGIEDIDWQEGQVTLKSSIEINNALVAKFTHRKKKKKKKFGLHLYTTD